MTDIIILGIVFFFVYKTLELCMRQKERNLMIKKMNEISPEALQSSINALQIAQNSGFSSNQFFSLRWAALLIGAGIGWPIGLVLYNVLNNHDLKMGYDAFELTLVATIAFCAGIALLTVYLIERKAYKETKKEHNH